MRVVSQGHTRKIVLEYHTAAKSDAMRYLRSTWERVGLSAESVQVSYCPSRILRLGAMPKMNRYELL